MVAGKRGNDQGNDQQERMRRLIAEHPPEPWTGLTSGWVYYLTTDLGTVVKIGTTVDLARRFEAYAKRHPRRTLILLAVEPGGQDLEQRRHVQFAPLRQCSEWFWHEAELAAHIASLDS